MTKNDLEIAYNKGLEDARDLVEHTAETGCGRCLITQELLTRTQGTWTLEDLDPCFEVEESLTRKKNFSEGDAVY